MAYKQPGTLYTGVGAEKALGYLALYGGYHCYYKLNIFSMSEEHRNKTCSQKYAKIYAEALCDTKTASLQWFHGNKRGRSDGVEVGPVLDVDPIPFRCHIIMENNICANSRTLT